jgi:NADH-quinone oxidoreductase subunit G
MLPVACYAEAEGSKINMEGRWQAYKKIVKPDEQVKDGWKIIRQLANELNLEGFDYFTVGEINQEMRALLNESSLFSNDLPAVPNIELNSTSADDLLYRVGSLPIYSTDALVRRATSLQQAQGALLATFAMHPVDIEKYNLKVDQPALVSQGEEEAIMVCVEDKQLLPGSVCIARGAQGSEKLGSLFSPIEID